MSAPRTYPLSASAADSNNSAAGSTPRPIDEHTGCRREIQRLLVENARLAADLSRTRARYDDLRQSAEIWICLYERQLRLKEQRP